MTEKIHKIAPLLADHFVDHDCDYSTIKRNKKLVDENAQRLGGFYKYLGFLHDSWVLKTDITQNKFSILLNDFTTHVFSDVIVDKKKLDIIHDKLVFPILIEFEINSVTYNTVDEDGTIRPIEPLTINEYLYEQVISIDHENIEIGFVVWKNGIKRKRGQQILILVNAKNINLTEMQDQAWNKIFGISYDNYYEYFKSQLLTGRYLSDQSICYELYDEIENHNNG